MLLWDTVDARHDGRRAASSRRPPFFTRQDAGTSGTDACAGLQHTSINIVRPKAFSHTDLMQHLAGTSSANDWMEERRSCSLKPAIRV